MTDRNGDTRVHDVVLTLDVDWAPDFVIAAVRRRIEAHHVPATWFITHASAELERLGNDRVERGIHPNFAPGSTHGAEPRAALEAVKRLVPDSTSMRTHGLYQSSRILDLAFLEFGIQTDVSLFLPGHPHLRPVAYPRGPRSFVRVPYYWEDDVEMARERRDWDLDRLLDPPGLKVFDFHPIHVYLNSDDFGAYRALDGNTPLTERSPEQVDPHIRDGAGVGTLFDEVLAHLEETGGGLLVREVVDHWDIADGGRP